MGMFTAGVLLFVVCMVGAIIMDVMRKKRIREENDAKYGWTSEREDCGEYVSGHPHINGIADDAFFARDPEGFLWLLDNNCVPVGRIDKVNHCEVVDRTTVETSERFTATRVATLGLFALAFPKKETKTTEQYLMLLKAEVGDMSTTVVFSFPSAPLANAALGFVVGKKGKPVPPEAGARAPARVTS